MLPGMANKNGCQQATQYSKRQISLLLVVVNHCRLSYTHSNTHTYIRKYTQIYTYLHSHTHSLTHTHIDWHNIYTRICPVCSCVILCKLSLNICHTAYLKHKRVLYDFRLEKLYFIFVNGNRARWNFQLLN